MRRKKVISASLRKLVIERDNGRCRACGIHDPDALQADHIIPESRGGDDSLGNLQALCGVCNNRKGNASLGELPIRDKIEGFGDFDSVMRDRQSFLEMVRLARSEELENARRLAEAWIGERVKGYVVRNRLGKMVGQRSAERIMRMVRVW